jgi:hypothetical protein
MSIAAYHAICWAAGRTQAEIKEEIARCEERYFKPYLWNEVGNAHMTMVRIETLKTLLT